MRSSTVHADGLICLTGTEPGQYWSGDSYELLSTTHTGGLICLTGTEPEQPGVNLVALELLDMILFRRFFISKTSLFKQVDSTPSNLLPGIAALL